MHLMTIGYCLNIFSFILHMHLMVESYLQDIHRNDAATDPTVVPFPRITVSLLKAILMDKTELVESLPEEGMLHTND